MDAAPLKHHLILEILKIIVEIFQNMVLEVPRFVAQALKLREFTCRFRTGKRKSAFYPGKGTLDILIMKRLMGALLEASAGDLHQ